MNLVFIVIFVTGIVLVFAKYDQKVALNNRLGGYKSPVAVKPIKTTADLVAFQNELTHINYSTYSARVDSLQQLVNANSD